MDHAMNCRRRLLLALSLLPLAASIWAEDDDGPLFEQGHQELLRRLLEQAMRYDTYNRRCRGFRASTYLDNVTRLSVERYGLTASQLAQQLWHTSLDEIQKRIDERFLADMRRLGGCKQAKRKGYRDRLGDDYWTLRRRLESLP
jgi:hypothetical protein